MDAPLLALTRRRAGLLGGTSPESAAAENMRQLAQLRWIAVAGQTATILVVHYGFDIALPIGWMLGAAALLGLANLGATIALPRHSVRNAEIGLALLLDMVTLSFQLYCSGGGTNPFVSLFLLQVVLGAILLPAGWVAILIFASVIFYGAVALEHIPLVLPPALAADHVAVFDIGRLIAFLLVAILLVLFITRISRNLRARDDYLADLRQHAAEEEGIVRMGLFASGAAHELGTPLGSLAVILADWRRVPTIARDHDLSAEVAEMQAEVQRCKAIVSDILHSAGQPRSEPLERMEAAAFAGAVADIWSATQPQIPFARLVRGAGKAAIVVEPALRQAVWNMLDNAAEASPDGITLDAHVEGDMLAIAVRDRGPGFAPDAIATVGRLYQSTKGAGHGLGLFLAANVARRLGGRLEARNLQGGGAEVRLLLPLAAPLRSGS